MSDPAIGALYVALGAGGFFLIYRAIQRGVVWGRVSWVERVLDPLGFWSSIFVYSLMTFVALIGGVMGLVR